MSLPEGHIRPGLRQQPPYTGKGTEWGGLPGEGPGPWADFTKQLVKPCWSSALSSLLQCLLHSPLLLRQAHGGWLEVGGPGGLGVGGDSSGA